MNNSKLQIGQTVNYTNGQPEIYTGKIVAINGGSLTIIDNEAGAALWNMGYSVGSCISVNQLV